ncbi:MAG TPA: hypothetical protein VIM56_08600 [Rhizomicrobium sp.]
MQGAFPPSSIGGAVATLAILFALSYAQFRHIALTLLVVLVPTPALAIAPADVWPIPYLCGYFVANVCAAQIRTRIAERMPGSAYAWRETAAELIWPPAMVCTIDALALVTSDRKAVWMTASTVAAAASAIVLVPFIGRYFPYDEEFIVRANRLRERRERWLDFLTFVVQPRWGWSVGGIAIIFAVLAYFGVGSAGATWPVRSLWGLPALLAVSGLVAFAATRDLRRTIGFLISATLLALTESWFLAILSGLAAEPYSQSVAIATMPCLLIAVQSSKFSRDGDNAAVATLRSLEQQTVAILFFSAGAFACFLATGDFVASALVLCGMPVALIVMPALTTAIYDLAPPRVSMDAYRIR